MPESFLHLKPKEQSQIYRALAPQLARSPVVLEKDVWVCWVLQTLFTIHRSTVSVLSPARTFWEKATLMHVECQRDEFRASAERLSRHWYDLAMLADQAQGQATVADRALLADVVKHKKVFYNASYANYDACLAGQLRLIPEDAALAALRDDFQRMIGAGMFIGEPPAFDAIIDRLRALETAINR
jgi:hypothetical protein